MFLKLILLLSIFFVFSDLLCQSLPDTIKAVLNSDVPTECLSQAERDIYIQSVQNAFNLTMIFTSLIFLFFTIVNITVFTQIVTRSEKNFVNRLLENEKKCNELTHNIQKIDKRMLQLKDIEFEVHDLNLKFDVEVCRTNFVATQAIGRFDLALVWGIRIINSESKRENIYRRNFIIEDYIYNIYGITEELVLSGLSLYEVKEFVINNIHIFNELSKNDLIDKYYKELCVKINANLFKMLAYS